MEVQSSASTREGLLQSRLIAGGEAHVQVQEEVFASASVRGSLLKSRLIAGGEAQEQVEAEVQEQVQVLEDVCCNLRLLTQGEMIELKNFCQSYRMGMCVASLSNSNNGLSPPSENWVEKTVDEGKDVVGGLIGDCSNRIGAVCVNGTGVIGDCELGSLARCRNHASWRLNCF